VAAEVKRLQDELKSAEEQRALFNKREAIFGQEQTDYSQLAKITKAFEPFSGLWSTAQEWAESKQAWLSGVSFNTLDPESMEAQLTNSQRTMYKLAKTFANTAGLGKISADLKAELEDFMPIMPLVTSLRNPGMRARHWTELTKVTGKDMEVCPKDEFTLTKLKELNLDETPQSLEAVTKVCDVAGKEYAIEQALDKMEAEWKGVNLEIVEYRETQTYVLKGFDEIQQLLDDHIVMTQSMSFSPFKGPFAQRIDEWEKLLVLMSDIFEEWLKCQRSWMYLEPIFSSEDIMRQLPTEGKRFAGVDRTWRKTLNAAHHDPDAVSFCKTPRLLQHFQEGNQMLEMVQIRKYEDGSRVT
jgi:dynein heavy chain